MDNVLPSWGDWGVFILPEFKRKFNSSEELMKAPLSGYFNCERAIAELIDPNLPTKDSLEPGLMIGLQEFASKHVPVRIQDLAGKATVYNPQRDMRPGAAASIPKRGPDVFEPILAGDDRNGHAIFAAFDQSVDQDLDDLQALSVGTRNLNGAEIHAVTVVNRFPAYVRLIDTDLMKLLATIGYYRDDKVLRTIPHGLNLVSFPVAYAETLSTMPVFDLYAMFSSTQQALRRGLSIGGTSMPYDVFFNIGPLVGGTIPRIHMQTYLRTKLNPRERTNSQNDATDTMRDFGSRDVHMLGESNRSWHAYMPPVRTGKFDLRLELKTGDQKEFLHLSGKELWDLSEMLIYHSQLLDTCGDINARNIEFFPAATVIKPFAATGGHERACEETIFGSTPETFASLYNSRQPSVDLRQLYRRPTDKLGVQTFKSLFDEESSILQRLSVA